MNKKGIAIFAVATVIFAVFYMEIIVLSPLSQISISIFAIGGAVIITLLFYYLLYQYFKNKK